MENLGKKKCEVLKDVRKKIAEANGIAYEPHKCNHEGDCNGTCPACEQEVRYIENHLRRITKAGKAAVIVGAAAGLAALGSSCSHNPFIHEPVGIVPCEVDTIVELEGDVEAIPEDTIEVDSVESPQPEAKVIQPEQSKPE